jgi:hypothetical protein
MAEIKEVIAEYLSDLAERDEANAQAAAAQARLADLAVKLKSKHELISKSVGPNIPRKLFVIDEMGVLVSYDHPQLISITVIPLE